MAFWQQPTPMAPPYDCRGRFPWPPLLCLSHPPWVIKICEEETPNSGFLFLFLILLCGRLRVARLQGCLSYAANVIFPGKYQVFSAQVRCWISYRFGAPHPKTALWWCEMTSTCCSGMEMCVLSSGFHHASSLGPEIGCRDWLSLHACLGWKKSFLSKKEFSHTKTKLMKCKTPSNSDFWSVFLVPGARSHFQLCKRMKGVSCKDCKVCPKKERIKKTITKKQPKRAKSKDWILSHVCIQAKGAMGIRKFHRVVSRLVCVCVCVNSAARNMSDTLNPVFSSVNIPGQHNTGGRKNLQPVYSCVLFASLTWLAIWAGIPHLKIYKKIRT